MQLTPSDILNALPHRPPMLMIDSVVSVVPAQEATAVKHVSFDEPCLQGHFPGCPVFPGVLIVEAMAQTACILAAYSFDPRQGRRTPYLMGIDGARFLRPVRPGDQIDLYVRRTREWGIFWQLHAKASVRGELVAEATLMATMPEQHVSMSSAATTTPPAHAQVASDEQPHGVPHAASAGH